MKNIRVLLFFLMCIVLFTTLLNNSTIFSFSVAPQEKWIEADGSKIWKIPPNAEILEINNTMAKRVRVLKENNQLIAFQGETIASGTPQDKEVAKLRTYKELAELLNLRINTFAQLVEGQIQSAQSSSSKEDVKSTAVSAYKRVTELIAQGTISGTYIYAVWRVKDSTVQKVYALLIYDPENTKEFVKKLSDLDQAIQKISDYGVDFFKTLNSVIDLAIRGTPLESKQSNQSQPPSLSQPTSPASPSSPTSPSSPPSTVSPPQPVNQPVNQTATSTTLPTPPTTSVPVNVKYMKGIGEAYGATELEAEENARKNALANLSEQLYVDVQSVAVLKEKITQVIMGSSVKERLETFYQRTIETKTQFEFVDVLYKVLDKRLSGGRYYAKVEANVDEQNAKTTFEIYVSLRLASNLVDGKLVYTAKSILDKYEPLIQKQKFGPKLSQEIASFVSKIKLKYNEVESLVKTINSIDVKDFKSPVKIAELTNSLDAIALDLPDNIISREKIRPFFKDVTIQVEGPSEVILGEQVTLKVRVNYQDINLLRTVNNNVEGQELVSLKDGQALVSAIVKSVDSKVTFSLGGIINSVWAPGKVSVNPDVFKVIYRDKEILKIICGGIAKVSSDFKISRERATKDALLKIVKKVAAEVLVGPERELLDIPIDDYIIDRVISSIDYEVTAAGENHGIYYVVLNSVVDKVRFENDIKEALRRAPSGFALLIVDGDSTGYVEQVVTTKIVNAGVKLVSKDFSKKLLEGQQRDIYDMTTLGKLSALSAARFVIYTKVNTASTWVSDYNVYSVRMLITTQIIDSITGNIISSLPFEDVNSGATVQSGISKIVNSQKFLDYAQSIVNSLNFENVEVRKIYKYTFVLERAAYGSILLDFLNMRFSGYKIIERADTKIVIEMDIPNEEFEKAIRDYGILKIKKISEYNYQVTK
ncbi:MAG: hypothetical protein ACK4MM_00720 [Fervidobacterium sp.]